MAENAEAAAVVAGENYSLSAGCKLGAGDDVSNLFGHDETCGSPGESLPPKNVTDHEIRAFVKAAHSIVIDWNSDRQVYQSEIRDLFEAMGSKTIRSLADLQGIGEAKTSDRFIEVMTGFDDAIAAIDDAGLIKAAEAVIKEWDKGPAVEISGKNHVMIAGRFIDALQTSIRRVKAAKEES